MLPDLVALAVTPRPEVKPRGMLSNLTQFHAKAWADNPEACCSVYIISDAKSS